MLNDVILPRYTWRYAATLALQAAQEVPEYLPMTWLLYAMIGISHPMDIPEPTPLKTAWLNQVMRPKSEKIEKFGHSRV